MKTQYLVTEETRYGYKCFGAQYDYWCNGAYQAQVSKVPVQKGEQLVSRDQIEALAKAGKLDTFQVKWLCDEIFKENDNA